MARIWKIPFAALGDKNVVPSSAQLDGSVSVPTGWTPDYQLEYADPDAKDISRADMNGILHDVTEAIGEIQTQGVPSWSADAAPYPLYAEVLRDSKKYINSIASNANDPISPASGWDQIVLNPTTTRRGFPLLASEDDILNGVVGKMVDASQLKNAGGIPRFSPILWGGLASAIPEEYQQSSGQQITDLMYPTMRAEVTASQFNCTEAEWQADPYKRATHWSLGVPGSWMRPPDKNGVQPGNVGSFYGAGSNPAGAKTGTAVIDAMRNLSGAFLGYDKDADSAGNWTGIFKRGAVTPGSAGSGVGGGEVVTSIDLSAVLPVGTVTDSLTGEFRPRTWYGIWVVRMYGPITNVGSLDASALNARTDLIDNRLSSVEGGRVEQSVIGSRSVSTAYQAPNTRSRKVSIKGTGSSVIQISSNGTSWIDKATVSQGVDMTVPATWYYRVNGPATVSYWTED